MSTAPTPADIIKQAFSDCPQRTYKKGEIMVFAGETPDYIMYITAGRVRQYDVSYRGEEVAVNIFKPPAFFPMSWALNKSQNRFFYKAESDVTVHLVPHEKAVKLLQQNPDITLDLLSRIYRGMDGLLGRMVQLMAGNAKSRVMYELSMECSRFGDPRQSEPQQLHITEIDIAARSGLSRETVSREMRKLKEQGLVTIEQRRIIIQNIAAINHAISST